MCRRNLFHYDLWVCMELQVLSNTASRLLFHAYKKVQERQLCKTYSLTMSQSASNDPERSISFREYPENYQK